MVVLALTSLIGALLVFRVAVNMGKKVAAVKELLESSQNQAGAKIKKSNKGSSRDFAPSKYA